MSRKIVLLFILALIPYSFANSCAMFAFNQMDNGSYPADMQAFLEAFLDCSPGTSNDGWSVLFYPANMVSGNSGSEHLLYRSYKNAHWDSMYEQFAEEISDQQASLIITHIRNTSSGSEGINNPHPFIREFCGTEWIFCHNGGVWGEALDNVFHLIGDDFLELHPPKVQPNNPVDSEIIFIYLQKILMEYYPGRSIYWCLKKWLVDMLAFPSQEWSSYNCLLSDGKNVYGVRVERNWSDNHVLFVGNEFPSGSYVLSSRLVNTIPNLSWRLLPNYSITVLPKNRAPYTHSIYKPGEANDNEDLPLSVMPNPSNTSIQFQLEGLNNQDADIEIYNIKGQFVRKINCQNINPVVWDTKNSQGNTCSSGIYLYRLVREKEIIGKGKIVLIK